MRGLTGAICAGIVALLLVSSSPFLEARGGPPAKSKLAQFASHISHIVFLMQENRAFDNFFGVYCQLQGTYCPSIADGVPPGTCVVYDPNNASKGCIRPYNLTGKQLVTGDMAHDWTSTHSAWNNGAMNGFFYAEGWTHEPFGHYNATTLPLYYDLAEQYGLADNFFSGAQSYSLANHWFMISGKAPSLIENGWTGSSIQVAHAYLNQSNRTPSIESELLNSSASWKYYDYSLAPYNASIGGLPGIPALAYDFWNPLAARAQSYQAHVRNHFVPRSTFFSDASNGTLPNVSWIIPWWTQSDHAPANITDGQNWVASIVDALETSPEWNSTVFFVTWDEYGGWYDHVPPPYLDQYGAGLRVPLLAIGPWVRQGIIDHTQMTFDSVLHLMEARFGLGCIAPRDCNAKLPLGMFNFNLAQPRYPIGFPVNGSASYPMPLQSGGTLPYFGPSDMPTPPPSAGGAPQDATGVDVVSWE